MSRLSHPRVASWLHNFPPDRRGTAALLIEALHLVSATEVRTELGMEIRRLLQVLPNPVAAFPVREVHPPESAHGEGRDGSYDLLPPGLPGSEAVIANVLTGISREPAFRGSLLTALDLSTLRSSKVRTLLLVDDFSGSGKRLKEFGKALRRHPTIRSWESYGLLEIRVVAYAATAEATRLLRSDFGPEKVHLVRACPTLANAGRTLEQAKEVDALCVDFCGRLTRYAYGFRNSKAMIAFEHTAPNNLPAILWRVDPGWNPLFEFKAVPPSLLGLFAMAAAPGPAASVTGEAIDRMGTILDMLDHRVREDDAIADATGISYREVHRLLKAAETFGLITVVKRLTDAGRVELRRWRDAHAPLVLPNRDDAYYPMQLRAGR